MVHPNDNPSTTVLATDSGPETIVPGPRSPGGSGLGEEGNGKREVRDAECQTTSELCLSPLTTCEIIPNLTHAQAVRELKYFKSLKPELKPRGAAGKTPNRAAINDCLSSAIMPSLLSDFDNISENIAFCHKLIKSFACTAEKLDKRSEEMERNISDMI